jgi:hypothetical protein
VLLYFSRGAGSFEVEVNALRLSEGSISSGGSATSIEGVISTRRGNAGNWMPMIGRPPIGSGELAFNDDPATRALFAHEATTDGPAPPVIEDILLMVSYSARTAEWPV